MIEQIIISVVGVVAFFIGGVFSPLFEDIIKEKWQRMKARKLAERERIKREWDDHIKTIFYMDTDERRKFAEWETREIEKLARKKRKRIIKILAILSIFVVS